MSRFSAMALLAAAFAPQDEGFTPLFNGKDLSGWVVVGEKSDWEVKDGVIACTKTSGKGPQWLRNDKEYENFVLRLEFKVGVEGGNSGVFVRAGAEGNPAYTGMEVQILDDSPKHKDLKDVQRMGALYASVAPVKNAAKKFGEWNNMEITCNKRTLAVVLNGEKILDVPNLDDETLPYKEKPLRERGKKGYIGLQNHKDPIEFRNIRIKELN